MYPLKDLPHTEDKRVCPDDLALAHETEVTSVVLASVHLPKVGRNVLSSKAHLGSEKPENIVVKNIPEICSPPFGT